MTIRIDVEEVFSIRESIFASKSDQTTAADYIVELAWNYNAFVEPLWPAYVDGYKNAADYLVDYSAERHEMDSLVYPIMFLYRHYLEIQLKDILRMLYLHHGKTCSTPTDHKLFELWCEVRPLMEEVYGDFEDIERNNYIEARVKEVVQVDVGSYAFRYPVDIERGIKCQECPKAEGSAYDQSPACQGHSYVDGRLPGGCECSTLR